MDLTSIFQKSTHLLTLLMLAVFAGVTAHANDTEVACGDQSTLVIVAPRLESAATPADDPAPSHNVLRPTAQTSTAPQAAVQRKVFVQNSSNQQNALKLHPTPVARHTQADKQVQVAEHQEVVIPPKKIDPVAEMLVQAHKLSQQASTEQQYSAIVNQCSKAIRAATNAEHRSFARQLSSWSLNRRGLLRADNRQADLADADFRAALDYQPNNWQALHNRGVSFAQRGQFAEAFEDFTQVIKLNPRFAKAYTNRATLYIQTDDLESALEDYQRAIEQDSQLIAAHIGLGRTCHMLSRWEEAAEHFAAAIDLDPTNAYIVCSRGDLLADMGRYRDALADYARTIELNPKFAHAYRNGAWLLATCPNDEFRDAKNAIIGAQQALAFGYGDRHVALDTLAAALANAGQFGEAMTTLQDALEIAPADAKAAYLSRLQLYEDNQPFRTQPVREVKQAMYLETGR